MRLRLWLAGACLVVAACGEEQPRVPAGYEAVTGSERLGWNQQASSAPELATFGYLVYVDDAAGMVAQNVTCASSPGAAGFACTSALPALTAGEHRLRLSAYVEAGGTRLESPPSEPLNVFKIDQSRALLTRTMLFSAEAPTSFTTTTSEGDSLLAQVAAEGLQDPTDMAFAPDGTLFLTERAGHVLLFRAGRLSPAPALTLPDVDTTGAHGLLSITVDPQFARNGFVYLAYTSEGGFRLARFRAVGDTLGDRALLLDGIPASPANPAASLRFGPDGRLFLAIDDAGNEGAAGDLGSFNGKILRLTADATTPADQASGSPIYTSSIRAPRGTDWDRTGAHLWVADGRHGDPGELKVIASAGDPARGKWGSIVARYNLPDGATGAGLAFYRADLMPGLRDNLLVAIEEPGQVASILRVVFESSGATTVARTERLLGGMIDGARAIVVSPDGIIFLATSTSLLTLGPAPAP